MLVQKSALVAAVALFACQGKAFVIAYDDTSSATYSSGWAPFSNGGYGFGQWAFSAVSTQGLVDSNTNGTLGGPGINVAGKSWQVQQGIGWGSSMASRTIGNFSIGNVFEIDADFGSLSTGFQSISLYEGALNDYVQIRSYGPSRMMEIQSTNSNIVTSIAYSDGGYRLGFSHTSASNLDVSITTLATNTTTTYSVLYAGNAFSHDVSIGGNNPVAGQELYTNRMQMTSPVPEPGTMLALGAGLAFLTKRRRNKAA